METVFPIEDDGEEDSDDSFVVFAVIADVVALSLFNAT